MSPINNQNSTVYQGFPERGSGLVRMKDGDSDDHEGRNGEFVLAWCSILLLFMLHCMRVICCYTDNIQKRKRTEMIREKKTKIEEKDFLSMCVCADGVGCKQPVNIYVKNIPVKNGSGGTSPSTSPKTSPSSFPRTSQNSSGFRQVHPIS